MASYAQKMPTTPAAPRNIGAAMPAGKARAMATQAPRSLGALMPRGRRAKGARLGQGGQKKLKRFADSALTHMYGERSKAASKQANKGGKFIGGLADKTRGVAKKMGLPVR